MTEKTPSDMNHSSSDGSSNNTLKETEMSAHDARTVEKKKRISKIWILPIVTIIIGIGMVYQSWTNRGVTIEVAFETAEGIEAGKTKLKNRNVDIGAVKSVKFSNDHKFIIAEIEVEKGVRDFLLEDSQFWVVRPRVSAGGVRGISTLLSGAYIQIAPGKSKVHSQYFIGLEQPPVTSPTEEGRHLTLKYNGTKPLNVGNPVIYRGLEVGAVESYHFDIDTRVASYRIFIRAPYHNLVTTNTHFWSASGISISGSAQGLRVDFASLETFVSGGVQFDVPEDLPQGKIVTQSRSFKLYDSKDSVLTDRDYRFIEFALLVENTVGGLYEGAPVEYRGVRVGTVHKPYLGFAQTQDIDADDNRIPVIVHIEPERITQNTQYTFEWFENQFKVWVKSGLTAKIENANILTSSLKVSLDLTGESAEALEYFGPYPVIPMRDGGFASIGKKVEAILDKLESLPLESVVVNASVALNKSSQTLGEVDASLLAINQTLSELQNSLKGVQPDSTLYRGLEGNLAELQRTLVGLQPLIKEIRNKPNSLIFSDPETVDEEPKAK